MEVERLTAVLEATGVSSFTANMAAADRATGGAKDQLKALAEVSKIATEALSRVKMTASQAAESKASAEAILSGVRGISEEARTAARELDRVHLSQAQAEETRIAADEQVRSLKKVEDQAIRTRVATNGGGGFGGGGGLPLPGLMPAAIGAGALLAPAAAPGAFGLLASIPTVVAGATGALGTLVLAFQGVSKAISGNKKAFDDLGASAQQFVLTVRSLDGWLDKIKQTAGAALFPGLTAGLKAALSPGTVAAVTQAIGEFGKAIGDAGAAWGRYFGSAQFQQILGPLMSSGAQNLGKMADAALHLFDALGVLGRAAIPLVNWMSSGADAASRWVDSFTRAKDASGVLSGALDQARQSLQLVGGLFTALVKVVYDLGAALYPVSKVAVKDLTGGLNAVAKNSKAFNDIALVLGGTLRGLTSVVKTLVSNLGGLRPVMDAAFGVGVLVVISNLLDKLKSIGVTLGLIPKAASDAAASTDASLAKIGDEAEVTTGKIAGIKAALSKIAGTVVTAAIILSFIPKNSVGQQALNSAGIGFLGHLPVVGGYFTQAGALGNKVRGWLGESTVGGNMSDSAAQAFLKKEAAAGRASIAGSAVGGRNSVGTFVTDLIASYGGNPNGPSADILKRWQAMEGGSTNNSAAFNFLNTTLREPGSTSMNSVGVQSYTSFSQGLKATMDTLKNYPAITQAIATGKWTYTPELAAELSKWSGGGYNKIIGGPGPSGGGASSASSVFGTPPPFTSGLGPKPPTPAVIPASATHLLNLASTNAANASSLSNTGGTAKRYLELELMDLDAAQKQLQSAYDKAHGKAKTQLDTALTSVGNKITSVTALIAKAIVTVGEALLPDKLVDKLNALTKKGQADADYAAALTGQAAVDYQAVIRKNLLGQGAVLQQMVAKLKTKIAADTGKQKTADEAELTKIQGQLDQVQQGVLASLQATVQALQGKVTTAFAAVQADLVKQLGNKYFQNGLQTPSEALLSQMQAADQLNSLTDSLDAAKKQQIQDQNTLSSVVYDMTTGLTTYNYSTAAQQQLDADNKAVVAAQRQLDEYNLSIKAAQERQSADQTYATQLDALNKQLGVLSDAFANGTGSISALKEIAKQFGLQITTANTPDLADLSSASKGLKDAFKDLADYIAKITGATPKIPSVPDSVSLLNSQALGDAQSAYVAANSTTTAGYSQVPGANVTDIVSAARDAGYTQSVGALRRMGVVPMADGGTGRVTKPTLFLAGEAGSEDYAFSGGGRTMAAGGGGVTVNLSVSALDPSSVDWGMVADRVRSEFVRLQRRNGGVTGIK